MRGMSSGSLPVNRKKEVRLKRRRKGEAVGWGYSQGGERHIDRQEKKKTGGKSTLQWDGGRGKGRSNPSTGRIRIGSPR